MKFEALDRPKVQVQSKKNSEVDFSLIFWEKSRLTVTTNYFQNGVVISSKIRKWAKKQLIFSPKKYLKYFFSAIF